jgi:hypothetical protein
MTRLLILLESYSTHSSCLFNVASATFTGNATDTIRSLLWSSFLLGSRNSIYKGMSHFKTVLMLCQFMFKYPRK